LDDPPLSETDEAIIDERLAGHHQDPSSPISLEALKVRIREQFVQNWLGTQFDKQPLAKLRTDPEWVVGCDGSLLFPNLPLVVFRLVLLQKPIIAPTDKFDDFSLAMSGFLS